MKTLLYSPARTLSFAPFCFNNLTAGLLTSALMLILPLSLCSQDFITQWTFADSANQIRFNARTLDSASYTWVALPSGNNGQGKFFRIPSGPVTLSGLNIEAGDVVTLSIEPQNLRVFNINFGPDKNRLTDVIQWGVVKWTDMHSTFQGCSNLTMSATDSPDLSGVISLQSMFFMATSFNQPIGHWDVSNITNMSSMFDGASSFNQSLHEWDVSNVKNMRNMFSAAHAFNQDLSAWDISRMRIANSMFSEASSFNQDLSSWDVSKVIDMKSLFYLASSFNQNLGAWKLHSSVKLSAIFLDSGMDCDHYTATLVGWKDNNPSVTNRSMFSNGLTYGTAAVAARDILINNRGWMIQGDEASGMPCDALFRSFVTEWSFSEEATHLIFNAQTSGPVSYIWETSPSGNNGSGQFEQLVPGQVDLSNLDIQPGDALRLEIDKENLERFYMEGSPDNGILTNVLHWGTTNWTSMRDMFRGCTQLNITATDIPNHLNVTDMSNMFRDANSFNGSLNEWDVSGVTDMTSMFQGANSFNQDLGSWILNQDVLMDSMLTGAGMGCTNYSATLSGWQGNNPTLFERTLGAGGLEYGTSAASERDELVTTQGWFINGDEAIEDTCLVIPPNHFIIKWKPGGSNSYEIKFGAQTDGEVRYYWETENSGNFGSGSFNQPDAGVVKIDDILTDDGSITLYFEPGNLLHFYALCGSSQSGLKDVIQWGDTEWISMRDMFKNCDDFTISAVDTPNLSKTISMAGMFQTAWNFDEDISHWDVSNVQDMFTMFLEASRFNQPIGSWDVSNVQNMAGMFSITYHFDQDLSNWDVSNVEDMRFMFSFAEVFNQNLGSWTLNQEVLLDIMLSNSALDCDHYTATLVGWQENNPNVFNRELGVEGLEFGTSAAQARILLEQEQGWTITGDSASEETCGTLVNTYAALHREKDVLQVFPNPASHILSVKMFKDAEVRVFNTLGIQQGVYYWAEGVSEFDISTWNPGVYFLSTGNQVVKFIKL